MLERMRLGINICLTVKSTGPSERSWGISMSVFESWRQLPVTLTNILVCEESAAYHPLHPALRVTLSPTPRAASAPLLQAS